MPKLTYTQVSLEDPEDIRPCEVRDLFDHWYLAGRIDAAPKRNELELSILRPLMENLALVQVSVNPPDVRYHIVGEGLQRLLGVDPTGQRPHDIFLPKIADDVCSAILKSFVVGQPSYEQCSFTIFGADIGYRRMLLPLAKEGVDTGYVIICAHPNQKWLQSARDWQLRILAASQGLSSMTESAWEEWSEEMKASEEIALV
ncbi:hypothetical protein ACKTEK_03555 [Tepidamorphus sp. 3E244]|uniref:hypothetical protein n=1 Tax=Tepidamorphus sp. 3E244 TaxID=3385498 RepID=UPI0038FBECA3